MEKSLVGENILFSDVCGIIDNSRKRVAVYVNSEICLVKWHVGKRIREDVLYNQRAEYGKQIVKNLSVKLTNKYGSGWSYESLKHCLRVANIFTEEEIGYAVRIQFSWTYICFDTHGVPMPEPIESLDLILKKEFALQILKGEKNVEFRSMTQHYMNRLFDKKLGDFLDKHADNAEIVAEYGMWGNCDELRPVKSIHFHNYNNDWYLDVEVLHNGYAITNN